VRSEGFYVNENSIDTSWDRTSDLPIVAQCLNNCATAVPPPLPLQYVGLIYLVIFNCLYVVASKHSLIPFFQRNGKECHHLSCFSFKIVPFCNYTFLRRTVNVLESFLEAVLWKPFPLFRRIFDCVSSITRTQSLQCCFQSREQVKISWSQVGEYGGCLSVVTLFFAEKSLANSDR